MPANLRFACFWLAATSGSEQSVHTTWAQRTGLVWVFYLFILAIDQPWMQAFCNDLGVDLTLDDLMEAVADALCLKNSYWI